MVLPGNIPLFEGIAPDDLQTLLSCVGMSVKSVKKGKTVIAQGSKIESLGIVVSGRVQVSRNDYDGNRVIMADIGPSQVFAESFVCAGLERSPVTVVASEDASILFLPFNRLMTSCQSACSFHQRLIVNLVGLLARKNLFLNSRLDITARRTIREKVLAYLDAESRKAGSLEFEIPFSRNELADYLAVDRSALSRELGAMRDGGLIDFTKARFRLC
ncbi:MAG TPA: Crp/Fnr family transcriptional regulator [Treponemataceae bacterium]|nr:Crp/Fnr family transcriptional regulator [Treponemataceae bacterium]HPS43753.1 Crp/Fnr family transcriptional regulator [Treponemataceae bacterium]